MTTQVEEPRTVVVRPLGRMNIDFAELWRERELLGFLASRSVRVRYKQALAGPAWAVFTPLMSMIVFSVIFGHLAKLPSNGTPYPVFYYCGLVLWTYFGTSITQGSNAIVENQQVVSKVYFPRAYLPLSAPVASLVDLIVATLVGLPLLLAYGEGPAVTAPLVVVAALVAMLAASGISLFLGALNAKYRDVKFVVPFLVQVGLFISPVAYSASLIPTRWHALYALNPMAGAIEWFRWALTGRGHAPLGMLAISASTAVAAALVGVWYFERVEGMLADVV